jgi:hypothetical protein
MLAIAVKVQDLHLKRKFLRAVKQFSSFKPEMEKTGDWLLEDARKRLAQRKSKWPTGRLGKSLVRKAFKFAATIISSRPYARIQQEGGVVRSKRPGGMLAIPLREKEGRSHTWPKMWTRKDGSNPLFVLRDGGKAFLAVREKQYDTVTSKTGKQRRKYTGEDKIELIYRLVPWVRIKGRPYLIKSPELIRYMRTLIVQKWERWKRGEAA